jgi:DNA primase
MIQDTKIQEIRDATDIVALIGEYLTLKKRGQNFIGLCPFHQEKTPSFNVHPAKQMFHCFGCHKAGDIFNFIMEHEKIPFMDAVRFLAERAGINIETNENDQLSREKEALYYANKFAANFFYRNLQSNAGQEAMNYLRVRGFDEEIIRQFGLGYSLPAWDGLIRAAQKKSINPEILHRAGLVIKNDNGHYYDRFRGRFMIPIINLSKKVVGFGGRILTPQENAPKYINSPETAIYHKGFMLYGLFRTRELIQKKNQAIFVEGYTDLISLYSNGVENVVATLGTALTEHQAKLIKRYTSHIVLLYDGDAAGLSATMRGADIFIGQGLDVKIIQLPDGEDPDTFIRKSGKIGFETFLNASTTMLKFKIRQLERQSTDRTENIRSVLESVANIKDQIQQDMALQEIAEHFTIDESAIRKQFQFIISRHRSQQRPTPDSNAGTPAPKPKRRDRYLIAEESLIKIVIQHPTKLATIQQQIDISDIQDGQLNEILRLIFSESKTNPPFNPENISRLIINPELKARLATLLSGDVIDENNLDKAINDSTFMLKKRKIDFEKQALARRILEAEKNKQDVSTLRQQYAALIATTKELEQKKIVKSEKKT